MGNAGRAPSRGSVTPRRSTWRGLPVGRRSCAAASMSLSPMA